ncbi:hypothetical protein NQZ68_019891 [Dissostichus eleginoides]|nr:hypothetical protein NQZ68_019891 [Dissostichus eleginoides]
MRASIVARNHWVWFETLAVPLNYSNTPRMKDSLTTPLPPPSTAVFPDRLIRSDQSQEPSSKVPGRSHCHRPSKLSSDEYRPQRAGSIVHSALSRVGTLSRSKQLLLTAASKETARAFHFLHFSRSEPTFLSTPTVLSPELNLDTHHMAACMLSAHKLQQHWQEQEEEDKHTSVLLLLLYRWSIAKSVAAKNISARQYFTPTAELTSQRLRGPGGRSSSTDWAKSNRANHLEKKKKLGLSRKIHHSIVSLLCSVSLLLGWPLRKPWARSAALLTLTLGLPVAKRASGKFSFAQSAGIESQIHVCRGSVVEQPWGLELELWPLRWLVHHYGGSRTGERWVQIGLVRLSEKSESAKGDHKGAQIFIQAPGSLLGHQKGSWSSVFFSRLGFTSCMGAAQIYHRSLSNSTGDVGRLICPRLKAELNHSPMCLMLYISAVDVKTRTVHWGPAVLGRVRNGVTGFFSSTGCSVLGVTSQPQWGKGGPARTKGVYEESWGSQDMF